MVFIDDLTGIQKRTGVIECLDDLMTFGADKKRTIPIITGYNFYETVPEFDSHIIFSHIHATEDYKKDMFKDLRKIGYADIASIREKTGVYLWKPKYNIRDDRGELLPYLKIKDLRTNGYINLNEFFSPLADYPTYADADGHLLAEDNGWQLDLPFTSRERVIVLSRLFYEKSSKYSEDHWSDAYETPVLLFGSAVSDYIGELPGFIPAVRFTLEENNNEISFIIRKNLEKLRNLPHYEELLRFGFKEELCFGNKLFIDGCVDDNR